MAASMGIGILTTLLIPEPKREQQQAQSFSTRDTLSLLGLFVCVVAAFIGGYLITQVLLPFKDTLTALTHNKVLSGVLIESIRLACAIAAAFAIARILVGLHWIDRQLVSTSYVDPLRDFFNRYKVTLALLLLALISVYRLSDIVLGVISNVFYQDMGYSKTDIAAIVKSFGLAMTIVGGFLGGVLSVRYGVMRILMLGAILGAGTNLLFMLLAQGQPTQWALIGVISADNLSAGLASAAFIAFLSSLTNVKFTATQYAIFSSLMTLFPKILGGYSGSIVDTIGYEQFFLLTAFLGLPAVLLILAARKRLELAPVTFK